MKTVDYIQILKENFNRINKKQEEAKKLTKIWRNKMYGNKQEKLSRIIRDKSYWHWILFKESIGFLNFYVALLHIDN